MANHTVEQIGFELRRITQHVQVYTGDVLYVDDDGTATVRLLIDDDDAPSQNVLVHCKPAQTNGIIIIPKDNSRVLVAEINGPGMLAIIKYSDIRSITINTPSNEANIALSADQIALTRGDQSIVIDGSIITLNGGSVGGVPRSDHLVTKLNAIENDLNSLKSIFSAWIPVPTDGGAALKTAITAGGYLTPLTPTAEPDVANDRVKQ